MNDSFRLRMSHIAYSSIPGHRNCQIESVVVNWADFFTVPGRAASGGALAPEPPRATRNTPECIYGISQKTLFFFSYFWVQHTQPAAYTGWCGIFATSAGWSQNGGKKRVCDFGAKNGDAKKLTSAGWSRLLQKKLTSAGWTRLLQEKFEFGRRNPLAAIWAVSLWFIETGFRSSLSKHRSSLSKFGLKNRSSLSKIWLKNRY